jgi:hypothetical protein
LLHMPGGCQSAMLSKATPPFLAGGNPVINVRISGFATPQVVASRAPQRSPLRFWMLFALEASFIAGVLALVLALVLPSRAPLARSADFATVRDAVWSRVNGTVNDPLTDIAPGISVRASSVRGFALNGRVYYYYFEGQRGFDPLSRGAVAQRDVEVLLRDADGPKPLVIYEIIH